MIRNEIELKETLRRIDEGQRQIEELITSLREQGATESVISTAVAPLKTFLKGYQEEVERYEGLKRGQFVAGRGLSALGKILVEARIAAGMSQRELAEKLGVHESSVSRDERNDYYGVTVDRACRILEATETRVVLSVGRSESRDSLGSEVHGRISPRIERTAGSPRITHNSFNSTSDRIGLPYNTVSTSISTGLLSRPGPKSAA